MFVSFSLEDMESVLFVNLGLAVNLCWPVTNLKEICHETLLGA